MSSLGQSIEALNVAWQVMQQRWKYTRSVWNDSVARDFEREFYAPLASQITPTQRKLDQLAEVVAQAQRRVR